MANQIFGITNSYHNLFGSFKHSTIAQEYDFNVIHFDDFWLKGKHIDDFATQIQEKTKPDVMICTLLGTEQCNPTEKFFEVFKDAGCKIIFLWPDFGRDWTTRSAARFDRFIHKNVAIACEETFYHPKTIWTWTPEDPTYFYFDGSTMDNFDKKDIDVSFLGTIHSTERQAYLDYLKPRLFQRKARTHIGGGQRAEKLSHEEYAEITRRSEIIINFPWSVAGNDQLKGRVFEATASGCLLLERQNNRTREFFKPGHDYIEYTSKEELWKLIEWYLEHHEQRENIAHNGWTTFNEKWNHNKFWENFFKEIDK